jgi:putative ABC transport system permease protein
MTSLGIGLAVGLVVLLLALSSGIQTSATTLAAQSGVDLIAVSANATSPLAGEFPPVQGAHSLVSRIPSVDPNVETASPWLVSDLVFGNASLWAAANSSSVPSDWAPTESGTVGWVPSENTGIQTPDLYNGTGFTFPGDPHYAGGQFDGPRTHEIVLDQALATVLHVWTGDIVWLGSSEPPSAASLPGWYENATAFRVAGISGPFWLVPSALLAFTYLSELQEIVGGASASTDYASLVLIHLTDPTTVNSDQTRLADAFPQMTVFTLASILGAIQHVVNLYRTFGELIGLIGVVVAALFATTVLQMSVDDRSRELALLRAIGHSRPAVGSLVVEEALYLSLFGLCAGLPIAFLTGYGLNLYLRNLIVGLPTSFSFVSFDAGVLTDGLLLVLAVGLIAAIAPAARAMQMPVAEELRAP